MPRVDHLLTWNMGCGPYVRVPAETRQRRLELLGQLIEEQGPSLIALQEAPSEKDLHGTLGTRFDLIRTEKGVVAAFDSERWTCNYRTISDDRIAVAGLAGVGAGTSLWFLSVHGPAVNVTTERKAEFVRRRVAALLRARRADDDGRLNIVAGDVNLPPFNDAITSDEGLRANRSWDWAAKHSSGTDRALFNCTWILLGKHRLPGTFYRSSVDLDGPWFGYDQIMLSAALSDHDAFAVNIIEKVGTTSLRKSGRIGMPDENVGSDHLPIVSKLLVA